MDVMRFIPREVSEWLEDHLGGAAFEKARESFDLSLHLEIFKAIHGIGEHATLSLDPDTGKH